MREVSVLPEPLLEFRYGQSLADPHDGLTMFGPYDSGHASQPRNVSYGLIGTATGIERFATWAHCIQAPILPATGENARLWPPWPGFKAAFGCEWPDKPTRFHDVDPQELDTTSRDLDANKRTFGVVDQYIDG